MRNTLILVLSIAAVTGYGQTNRQFVDTIVLLSKEKYAVQIDHIDRDEEKLYFYAPGREELRSINLTAMVSYHREDGIQNILVLRDYFQLNTEGQVEKQRVVQLDSVSTDEAYNRARLWFGEHFSRSDAVLELDDRDAGILMGKGWGQIKISGIYALVGEGKCWYEVKLEIREGRYRYTLRNITLDGLDIEGLLYREELYHADGSPKRIPKGSLKTYGSMMYLIQAVEASLYEAMLQVSKDW